jgi:hypothetical protein
MNSELLIKNVKLEKIQQRYNQLCMTGSDINEHLPTIFEYAKNCESILETGVRGVVSSWALSYGLLFNNSENKRILFNDISECNIGEILDCLKDLNVNASFEWINNLNLNLNERFDMVFIDTWHIYGQLKRELIKFSPITNKYIIMHDTTVDEIYGETIRWMGGEMTAVQQSLETGIPVDEILKGLGPAIQEFLDNNPDWILREKFVNNNGLTILEKIS